MPHIKVHEKALAHLSRGLYRSPASALRELVSNAWDANAEVVRIDTNYPNFYQLSVEDNGDGFSEEEFRELMEGGIGNSQKRPSEKKLKFGRPVIGRLGIGMLGIAQVCGGFTIASKPRDGKGFRAHVRLYDYIKERLDSNDPQLVTKSSPPGDDATKGEVHVGEYDFKEYDPAALKHGTLILADDLHPTYIKAFRDSVRVDSYKPPHRDWKKTIAAVSKVHSLQELGDYWRLIWELAAACPVPYVTSQALPSRLVIRDQNRLSAYKFALMVDGLPLYKPVYLTGNPGGYTTLPIESQMQRIYNRDLSFHGYIVVQEGTSLRPDELRGILIRIKNVGIGYYDPSMLDYRFNEGPRSRWLTGEIYIDAGLEDALNIDRDSFNRFHPQFRAVQEYIHSLLRNEVFPKVYKQIDVRSQKKAAVRAATRTEQLTAVISDVLEKPVQIKESKQVSDPPGVSVSEKQREVEITVPPPGLVATKKANRQLATAILTIFEVAQKERSPAKQREVFTSLLLNLLERW